MQLASCLQPLALSIDVLQLEQEVAQFSHAVWRSHAPHAVGSESIPLISVGGQFNQDYAFSGALKATSFLQACPSIQSLLKQCQRPISRCRLTRLAAMTHTPLQQDWDYHWLRRALLYIPIITDAKVHLFCQQKSQQMAAGEAWLIDNSRPHRMLNRGPAACVHLVIELKGNPLNLGAANLQISPAAVGDLGVANLQISPAAVGGVLADLEVSHSQISPAAVGGVLADLEVSHSQISHSQISHSQTSHAQHLPIEEHRLDVLTPPEFNALNSDIQTALRKANAPAALIAQVAHTQQQWQRAYAQYAQAWQGELAYQTVILQFREDMAAALAHYLPAHSAAAYAVAVIQSMLATAPATDKRLNIPLLLKKRKQKQLKYRLKRQAVPSPRFDRPIFIVSAPRSGSTLLFNTLTEYTALWTIAEESHGVIENIAALHPATHQYRSNRLTANDAQTETVELLKQGFVRELQNQHQQAYLDIAAAQRPAAIRFLEKTPKNALRIPFFKAAFPDALFIYLYRRPEENISSLVEGWRSRRYIAYQPLPGWSYKDWSFLLAPGWENLSTASVFDIAAFQWKMSNLCIWQDIQALPTNSYFLVNYQDLIHSPAILIKKLSEFAELELSQTIEQLSPQTLPLSSSTISTPASDKWRKNEQQINLLLPQLRPLICDIENLFHTHPFAYSHALGVF